MITAQQARENISNGIENADLNIVYKVIEKSSKEGKEHIWIVREKVSEEQIKELQDNGFSVEKDSVNDYKISW